MADRHSILMQASEHINKMEEAVYRAHVKLGGDASYEPMTVQASQLKGDREAIATLARSATAHELADLLEALAVRLVAAEQEMNEQQNEQQPNPLKEFADRVIREQKEAAEKQHQERLQKIKDSQAVPINTDEAMKQARRNPLYDPKRW
jgi:hypothetical protein